MSNIFLEIDAITLVLQKKQENPTIDMAKIQIRSERLTLFGGLFLGHGAIWLQINFALVALILILGAIKELTQENISYTSDMGKTYDFNTADTLNTLLLNCIFASGQLKGSEMYDVDFDHQFIETEKYDAKPTYKKFLGYRPGVAVIGGLVLFL